MSTKINPFQLVFCIIGLIASNATVFAGQALLFNEGIAGTSNPSAGTSATVNLSSYPASSITIDVSADAYAGSQQGGGRGYTGMAEAIIGSFVDRQSVPAGGDPMSVSARSMVTLTKSAGGTWLAQNGTSVGNALTTSASAYVNGEDAIGSASVTGWIYWVDQTVGTINVSSNVPASWTLTGPAMLSGSGTGQSYTNQPTGIYTISWSPVSGYTTPPTQSLTLTSGAMINFSAVYGSLASCPKTVINPGCSVELTNHGGSSGLCASGYSGTCSYTCSNGTWTRVTNDCRIPASVNVFFAN